MGTNDSLHVFARNAEFFTVLTQVCVWYIHVCKSLQKAPTFLSKVLV
jgi:hypothetical protein